jgi:hypothetical protein
MQPRSEAFDAIVVGSGISGGWAAKELTERVGQREGLALHRGQAVRLVPGISRGWPLAHLGAAELPVLDEIAETILPETSTPGAKAAEVGALMALMVTEVYDERERQVFQQGLRQLDEACRQAHASSFMQASAAQRLSLVEALDREQHAVMEDRAPKQRVRAPASPSASDEPAHYFRLMKELTLLGYFTSEIGCTQAMRYAESPGRFDPHAPRLPGDKSWASHA